jgi:hypothetical protein
LSDDDGLLLLGAEFDQQRHAESCQHTDGGPAQESHRTNEAGEFHKGRGTDGLGAGMIPGRRSKEHLAFTMAANYQR